MAEGVETENQALELARLGCEFAQGYLFFKPLSAVAMTALAEFERQPEHALSASSGPSPVGAATCFPAPSPSSVVAAMARTRATAPAGSPLPPPGEQQQEADKVPAPVSRDEIGHLLRPLLSSRRS